MNKKLFLLIVVAFIGLTSATKKPDFSVKVYGNVANFFESEADMITFFDFHPGDIGAEVGAGYAKNLCGFSIVADSVTLYMQDIDTTILTEKRFNQAVKCCNKHKKPMANTFLRCIGTVKSTNLPDNTFDKIILIATFHEFVFFDEMMTDIYRKLKPDGQLYILEAHCFTQGHKNY